MGWHLWFMIFRLGSFAWGLSIGILRLGSVGWDPSLGFVLGNVHFGTVRLVTFPWEIMLGNSRLRAIRNFRVDLFGCKFSRGVSLGPLRLRTFALGAFA